MARTVTISSSYGAEGAMIGRIVADRLGLELYDRAIPVAVARDLDIEPEEAFARDAHAPGRLERILNAISAVSLPFSGVDGMPDPGTDAERFRQTTEEVLRSIADGPGGVVLGRASMVVLGGRPDVLCVRLDGPPERRVASMVARTGIDSAEAERERRQTDDAREAYVQLFYGRSQNDAHLYDLVLDVTNLSDDACVDIILRAASDRFGER